MLNTYNTTLFNHSPQIGWDSLEREVGRITHTDKNTQARVFYWPMVTWSWPHNGNLRRLALSVCLPSSSSGGTTSSATGNFTTASRRHRFDDFI